MFKPKEMKINTENVEICLQVKPDIVELPKNMIRLLKDYRRIKF